MFYSEVNLHNVIVVNIVLLLYVEKHLVTANRNLGWKLEEVSSLGFSWHNHSPVSNTCDKGGSKQDLATGTTSQFLHVKNKKIQQQKWTMIQPKTPNGWIQREESPHSQLTYFIFLFFNSSNETDCTHLRHMARLSKLCQRKQYWWDVAPHQHWKGLGTLCNTLWTRKTAGHCCERKGTQEGAGYLFISCFLGFFYPLLIVMFTWTAERPHIHGVV